VKIGRMVNITEIGKNKCPHRDYWGVLKKSSPKFFRFEIFGGKNKKSKTGSLEHKDSRVSERVHIN